MRGIERAARSGGPKPHPGAQGRTRKISAEDAEFLTGMVKANAVEYQALTAAVEHTGRRHKDKRSGKWYANPLVAQREKVGSELRAWWREYRDAGLAAAGDAPLRVAGGGDDAAVDAEMDRLRAEEALKQALAEKRRESAERAKQRAAGG